MRERLVFISDGSSSGYRAWHSAMRWDAHAGNSSDMKSPRETAASQSILAGSSRVLILIAARHAMDAAIALRRSSMEVRRNSRSAISRISNRHLFDVARAHSRRRGLHGDGSIPEWLGFESERVQLLGDPRIFDLLRGAQSDHQGDQKTLCLDLPRVARRQNLFEQDPSHAPRADR